MLVTHGADCGKRTGLKNVFRMRQLEPGGLNEMVDE